MRHTSPSILAVLSTVDADQDWQRVSTLLNCTTIERISVYNSFSTQDALTMLLCFCSTPSDEVQPLVVVLAPQLEDLLGPTVELRLYDNLSISTGVNSFQPRFQATSSS
ncbi:hypothetical protein Hypma_007428 [Hypsizygus marmoreus]|uniref:Uncharacterized protein n=1 Tax=Hypsizygus marmoreus TaxID=39966 RepID=A0A369JZV0_HYPMA|nr:hypothetical protein Hypma_007428 [Hypsizygus marmoreus]